MTARFLTMFALLLMVACSGQQEDPSGITTSITTTLPSEEPPTTTELADPEQPGSALPREVLDEIVADAARRSGVETASIEVTSIEAMMFNDAALGCPEPGRIYAQVLTPGFVIQVDAGVEEFDYRVAEGGDTFRLCE